MLKKLMLAGFMAVVLLSAGLQVRASQETGQILVWLRDQAGPIRDGSLEIYRTGDPAPEGYLLGPEFGGGIIAGEDVLSPEFARWMAQKAGPGRIQIPDEEGLVRFEGLEPGMYLIRQGQSAEGYYAMEPYLACVSEELLQVDTYPAMRPLGTLPRTAQPQGIYFATLLMALALTGIFFLWSRRSTH